MSITKHITITMVFFIFIQFHTSAFAGDKFTSETFLTYSEESRTTHLSTAATMAGVIAAQNKPAQARCIDEWVTKQKPNAFPSVTRAMKKHSTFHPLGVLLAVLQKTCGSFSYAAP